MKFASNLRVVDFKPLASPFCEEVLRGLTSTPKYIQSKFFYDKTGSLLFEKICTLPEYYPTRTEAWILDHYATEIASAIGTDVQIIEFGSGSSTKTRLLLDSLDQPSAYMPLDISKEFLIESANSIAQNYPELEVIAVCADYSKYFALPEPLSPYNRKVAFFPGSTIGNLVPEEAVSFLKRIREWCGNGGGLILGADLKKDPAILNRAYNDSEGITAAFNLNLLTRINNELQPEPPLMAFQHFAFYNKELGRIEMHLVAQHSHSVSLKGTTISFEQGEHLITEYSYKYTIQDIKQLASEAGLTLRHSWMDPGQLFSVHYLEM